MPPGYTDHRHILENLTRIGFSYTKKKKKSDSCHFFICSVNVATEASHCRTCYVIPSAVPDVCDRCSPLCTTFWLFSIHRYQFICLYMPNTMYCTNLWIFLLPLPAVSQNYCIHCYPIYESLFQINHVHSTFPCCKNDNRFLASCRICNSLSPPEGYLCTLFTCGRTCVVPPLCLGAAFLCVFPLSRGWIGRDDGRHKLAPGTRDNDTVLRHCEGSNGRKIGCSENSNNVDVAAAV